MPKSDGKVTVPPREVRISDLQLAAYLLALDYPVLRTEGASPRTEFIFAGVPEETVYSFYQGAPLVNARKLFDAYRNLRGLLHQQDGGRRR